MDVALRQVPGRRCKVLFSYQPANDDELELQVGDIIDILSEVEEGWWKGKLKGQVGVFPSNFVAEVFDDASESKQTTNRKTSKSSLDSDSSRQSNTTNMNHEEPSHSESDVPELPPKPVKELCRVMFMYEAVNDDELTLREGDIITLISREGQDAGWWRGELNGRVGVFPDNFVQVITAEESKPARPPTKTSAVTTNRVKDSITRPLNTAPQTTAQRKSIEVPPKPEEKTSPPSLSKKPVLPPPPFKKPQRSPSGASIDKALGVSQPGKTGATSPSKSPDHQNSSATTTTVSAKIPLTPLTYSLKQSGTDGGKLAPSTKAEPASDGTDGGCLSRNSGSFTPLTGAEEAGGEVGEVVDLDCISRSAMLTHPTASRVRAPRRRPPSGVPLKESGETSPGLVNGSAEPHFILPEDKLKAPWVEELKMNQAKKNSAQGRTRVMIGSNSADPPTSLSPEPVKTEPQPLKVSPSSTVTLRSHTGAGARPQSMFGGRSFSLSPSPSSPSPATSSTEASTVSMRQWNELNEKVQRLETQHESLLKLVKELSTKLAEEMERRLQMQAEMEKLANFVTQV